MAPVRLGVLIAWILAGCGLAGCGGGAAEATTKSAAAPAPSSSARRPDGIVIDLPSALPRASDRADGRGVVTLREPLSRDALVAVVRAYTQGFLKEDPSALQALLAQDAVFLAPPQTPGVSSSIMEVWGNRLRSFDYTRLAGAEIFRADKIEILTFEDTKDVRPGSMRPEDVFVIVPIQTPRVGTDALFPERISMLLRREKGRYVIAAVAEDFTP